MELQAGRRWQLTSEDSFLVLTAGQVEVYAVTRDERHYRQAYLLNVLISRLYSDFIISLKTLYFRLSSIILTRLYYFR